MLAARADHICVALGDGTVLVAGGVAADGSPTSAAEIFHPDSGEWTPTGPLLTPRRRASAVLLSDGKVLIAGGEAAGHTLDTFEIYDPVAGLFEQAPGTLSAARTGYALAALDNGRVLVAGGFAGEKVVDSIDIYDSATGIAYAGRMLSPRANFTATPIGDGKVLFVGGTNGSEELASAEIFDSASGEAESVGSLTTARQNHVAIRSRRSGSLLIASGSRKGSTVGSGEFFSVTTRTFGTATELHSAESGKATITLGILNADATIRASKTFQDPVELPFPQ